MEKNESMGDNEQAKRWEAMKAYKHMDIAPSCQTQNFMCQYLVKVTMKHGGMKSNQTDLDFEVKLDNSDLHAAIFENIANCM